MIISKSSKYYADKIRIDKRRNRKVADKVQAYNNNVVDEYVESYDDGVPKKTATAILFASLVMINKPAVYKNYQRIIKSPYTKNDNITKMFIRNKANNDLNRIVESEVERINKNLNYVEQVMNRYDISQKDYEQVLNEQRNRSLASRQEVLKEVAVKKNEILVSEGLNIPSNVFTYRNLDLTAESLQRQSQMQSKHEEIKAINNKAVEDGKNEVYTHKVWIWTGEGETTRHESNNMQKRLIDEPFIIVNDKTLEIDELMYPSDPNGSPSNTYICYCDIDYTNEDGDVSTFW